MGASQPPPKPIPVLNGDTLTTLSDLATPPDYTPVGTDTGTDTSSSAPALTNGISAVETPGRLEVTDKDGSVYVRIETAPVNGEEEKGQRNETDSWPEGGGRGTEGGGSVVGKGQGGGGGGGGQGISLTNDLLYDLD